MQTVSSSCSVGQAVARDKKTRRFLQVPALMRWKPAPIAVPRALCHFTRIPVRGIARRHLGGALKLQIAQLTNIASPGLAWRTEGDEAQVWYWNEDRFALPETHGYCPWPEPTLRQRLPQGVHLLACLTDGYEAVCMRGHTIHRTRWFRTLPSLDQWNEFLRDAGMAASASSCPPAEPAHPLPRPGSGWRVLTRHKRPYSATELGTAAAVAIAGAALISAGLYEQKLRQQLTETRGQLEQLARENATTLELQREIEQHAQALRDLGATTPAIRQLELMSRIANSGLAGESSGIFIAEWESLDGRLRLLLSTPPKDFKLGGFLQNLESTGLLASIQLMPDTPPQTVGIQAHIVREALAEPIRPAKDQQGAPTHDQQPAH